MFPQRPILKFIPVRVSYEMRFAEGVWMRRGILVSQLRKSFLLQGQTKAGEGNEQRLLTQGSLPGQRKGRLTGASSCFELIEVDGLHLAMGEQTTSTSAQISAK